jgi:hypothetical protein
MAVRATTRAAFSLPGLGNDNTGQNCKNRSIFMADIATNRQARHRYHFLDTWEAGLVLTGTEVKSLREGKAQIKDGYASVRGS